MANENRPRTSELADPVEQRSHFSTENTLRYEAGKPVHPVAENFLRALEHMPELTGNAMGINRLVMVLVDTDCIDDVANFSLGDLKILLFMIIIRG